MAHLFRLTIAKRLLLGFLSNGILTILVTLVALSSLQRLNEINNRIIDQDVPLLEITDKMTETLLAQEHYARRSLILKSPEMEALFWKRSEEFQSFLQRMDDLPGASNLPLNRLALLHEQYNQLFKTGLKKGEEYSSPAFQDRDRQIRRKQEELAQLVKGLSLGAREDQNEKSLKSLSIGHSAFWITATLSITGLVLGIVIVLIITRNISRSINQLKLSTRQISSGEFDHLPEVRNQDELGELARSFSEMGKRLKRLEEMYLDTSPLTRLPG